MSGRQGVADQVVLHRKGFQVVGCQGAGTACNELLVLGEHVDVRTDIAVRVKTTPEPGVGQVYGGITRG